MRKEISLIQAKNYLDHLDLNYLALTMCAESYPLPRWQMNDAIICLQRYKNFLWLQKKYIGTPLVPTREIDECWHNHILFTRLYVRDCLQIFGHYLHHDPFPIGQDTTELIQDYLNTKTLYEAEFGQSLALIQKT